MKFGYVIFYGPNWKTRMNMSDKIGRWKPSGRLALTNYTDENEGSVFMKYKLGLDYDIANFKLTPGVGFEVYQDLENSGIYKYRSGLGMDYKLNKKISLTGAYKLDYFMTKAKNRHIVELGLKMKL